MVTRETNSGLTDGILTQTPAMPVQCSTNCAIRPTGRWSLCGSIKPVDDGCTSIYIYIHDFHASTESYKIVVICYSKFLR